MLFEGKNYCWHLFHSHGNERWGVPGYKEVMGDENYYQHQVEAASFRHQSHILIENEDIKNIIVKNSIYTAMRYQEISSLTKRTQTKWGEKNFDAIGIIFLCVENTIRSLRFSNIDKVRHTQLFALYFASVIARENVPFFLDN